MSKMISHLIWLFERDLGKLKEELNLYKNESDIWIVDKEIKNSAGSLAVHLTGSLNFFIGTHLAKNGYVRERDKEFSDRNVPKETILKNIDAVVVLVKNTLANMDDASLSATYPIEFIGKSRINMEILMIMYGHINYHLGQVNYHRRILCS